MPYRSDDEHAARERAARDVLAHLADEGDRRTIASDRPTRPPPAPRRRVELPFPVSEDPACPVNEQRGMTVFLWIHVETAVLSRDDTMLIRRALRSFHPVFDLHARTPEDDALHRRALGGLLGEPPPNPGGMTIEIPTRPIEEPGAWIRRIIEDLLPVVHDFRPIRAVRYGRDVPRLTM